jgi:uncharacterized spore protein YtfJ
LKGTVEELDKLINAKNVLAEPIEKNGAVDSPMVSYGFGVDVGGRAARRGRPADGGRFRCGKAVIGWKKDSVT